MIDQPDTATRTYQASKMWQQIGEAHLNREMIADLAGFKNSEVNYRLALVNVQTNGVRFLKTLIYGLAGSLSKDAWAGLTRIRHREVGDPISVTYHGEQVDLDYLRAALELEFIAKQVDLDKAEVLEIGAGYGRTAHAIISNHEISGYCVVDLPNTLELSRKYLAAVLTEEQFAKVDFVPVDEIESTLADRNFDLCLNIDSMAEMSAETVRSYLALIDQRCRHFYVNNPVGKYMDKSLDSHARGEEAVALALSTGLLTEIIDIHDNRAVEAQARNYVEAYVPGPDWHCVADEWAPPWSYLWQALYKRQGR
ncbi:MAG TPA: putative sugar O-methyltransferase [Amycolatopsis sp.]|nr:putative sugar O-methyltransferase [Amycolatopsis sp.]